MPRRAAGGRARSKKERKVSRISSLVVPVMPRVYESRPRPRALRLGGGALGLLAAIGAEPRTRNLRPVMLTGRSVACLPGDEYRLLDALRAHLPEGVAAALRPAPRGEVVELVADHVDWTTARYVPAVTRAFAAGIGHVLVGTRALLGEGWDCPAGQRADRLHERRRVGLRPADAGAEPAAGSCGFPRSSRPTGTSCASRLSSSAGEPTTGGSSGATRTCTRRARTAASSQASRTYTRTCRRSPRRPWSTSPA